MCTLISRGDLLATHAPYATGANISQDTIMDISSVKSESAKQEVRGDSDDVEVGHTGWVIITCQMYYSVALDTTKHN